MVPDSPADKRGSCSLSPDQNKGRWVNAPPLGICVRGWDSLALLTELELQSPGLGPHRVGRHLCSWCCPHGAPSPLCWLADAPGEGQAYVSDVLIPSMVFWPGLANEGPRGPSTASCLSPRCPAVGSRRKTLSILCSGWVCASEHTPSTAVGGSQVLEEVASFAKRRTFYLF